MYKYIGDSILNASFTVLVPKPLDNRTVVNNINELYSIPATYAYLGMTVANIDNGNIYMLVDKSKISQKAGWRASYESIQIITCTYDEYKEWELNTDENSQPIDGSKDYLHQDTYYYIYEDSLPENDANQEYVKRADWEELLNTVSLKASNSAVTNINSQITNIKNTYATLLHVQDNYAPLSMFSIDNEQSFIRTNFFTKDEAIRKFVKFSDLSGGEELDENDYVFVTVHQYQQDLDDLIAYKREVANELAQCLKIGQDGALDTIIVSYIKSPEVDGLQLTVNVTPQGLSIGNDPIAKISDIPPHVTLTKAEYEALVENDEVDEDTYYHITDDTEAYVLASDLQSSYDTAAVTYANIATDYYKKTDIDSRLNSINNDITTRLTNYYASSYIDENFVTNDALNLTLNGYVTIAMIGGESQQSGLTFIFTTKLEFSDYVDNVATLRTNDLDAIAQNYVAKDSAASLTSLETQTISYNNISLVLSEALSYNNKELAFKLDVPVIEVISLTDFDLLSDLEKEDDVYYFVYNVDPQLALVTADQLQGFLKEPDVLRILNERQGSVPTQLSDLTDDENHRTVTDAEKAVWNAKSDFSGSYNDLTDKPIIPSQLDIDNALLTKADISIIGNLGNISEEVVGQDAIYTAVENGTTLTEGETYYTSNTGEGEFISDGTEVSDGTNYFILSTPAIAHQDAIPHTIKSYVDTSLGGLKLVKITESAYNALQIKDLNTLYIITVDPNEP